MVETRTEEKNKSPAKGAGASDAKSEICLLVRKRITYTPKEKKDLELLELGHWLTAPVKTPYEALEILKAFGMPKTAQIVIDSRLETAEVTIKKRHLRAREKVKKDRHEELTTKITGVKDFVKFLKHYEMLGDQVDAVSGKEEALTIVETFKKRIAPKAEKKE